MNLKQPEYLYLRLVRESSNNTRNNICRKLGQKPDSEGRSMFTKNQFCNKVYNIYNKLPSQITSIVDHKKFKKNLKIYLYQGLLPNLDDYPIYGMNLGI